MTEEEWAIFRNETIDTVCASDLKTMGSPSVLERMRLRDKQLLSGLPETRMTEAARQGSRQAVDIIEAELLVIDIVMIAGVARVPLTTVIKDVLNPNGSPQTREMAKAVLCGLGLCGRAATDDVVEGVAQRVTRTESSPTGAMTRHQKTLDDILEEMKMEMKDRVRIRGSADQ